MKREKRKDPAAAIAHDSGDDERLATHDEASSHEPRMMTRQCHARLHHSYRSYRKTATLEWSAQGFSEQSRQLPQMPLHDEHVDSPWLVFLRP